MIYAILSILNTTNRNSLLMMMIVIIPFFIERFCGKRRIGAGRGDNDSFKDGIESIMQQIAKLQVYPIIKIGL